VEERGTKRVLYGDREIPELDVSFLLGLLTQA
jgi:hypothetical protein